MLLASWWRILDDPEEKSELLGRCAMYKLEERLLGCMPQIVEVGFWIPSELASECLNTSFKGCREPPAVYSSDEYSVQGRGLAHLQCLPPPITF